MNAVWIRLRRQWFRNLLAVLQVAVAIAAVTAVLVDVVPLLGIRDDDAPEVYVVRYGSFSEGVTRISSAFLPDDVPYLLEHSTTVEAASAYDSDGQAVIAVDGERWAVRGKSSVHPSFAALFGLEMVAGTFFTEEDTETTVPRVAVISDELATLLFGTVDVVGKTITLRPDEEMFAVLGFSSGRDLAEALARPGDELEIVGVYKTDGDIQLAMLTFGQIGELLTPLTVNDTPLRPSLIMQILFRPRPGMEREAVEEVRQLLASRLEERGTSGPTDGVPFEVMVEARSSAQQLRQARLLSSLVLGALGLAALAVSSIAMFTTTLANLAPRTRYIGLSRALGATRSRIVREVVIESALVATIGGVIGAVLAFPLRSTVFAPLFSSLPGQSPPGAFDLMLVGFIGVALAAAGGAAAALYPAWTVARLAPADAWREGTV